MSRLTKEEQAVIDAALNVRESMPDRSKYQKVCIVKLKRAVDALHDARFRNRFRNERDVPE